MIELNLVPDVKQELLKAQRVRTAVISVAIVVGIAAVGIVALLALYLFGVQTVRSALADSAIKSNMQKLQQTDDLSNILTIQNQLSKLSAMHNNKNIDSRIFSVLTAINPASPNDIVISSAKMDADNKLITIEGQAANGYEAAELFKKTILSTTMTYKDPQGTTQKVALTKDVSTTDMSYGEDASGKKVLRFTMSFTYPDEFFARSSQEAVIERPDRKNVTDSYLRIPQSLFSERATDLQGNN
jgi:hypothetical protein